MNDGTWMTIKATLDDPEYDQIEIRVRRKAEVTGPLTSWGIERAVVAWFHTHLATWTRYIVENGMKTL